MQEIIDLIANSGLNVVCVAFMIYLVSYMQKELNKTMTEVVKTLVSIQTSLSTLILRVDTIEQKIEDNKSR